MGYRPLVDFHPFPLTKWFPITPSTIYDDVILFQSLDVAIFVVLQPNCIEERATYVGI
jgi:hypothetical protein